jgi:hypothetical protein
VRIVCVFVCMFVCVCVRASLVPTWPADAASLQAVWLIASHWIMLFQCNTS